MTNRRTYVDANLLIAWHGQGEVAEKAWAILDDPERTFVLLRLLGDKGQQAALLATVREGGERLFEVDPASFRQIPGAPFARLWAHASAPTTRPRAKLSLQIGAAPLWPLFRHKPWQKILKDTGGRLEQGGYDWAHLAMNYWPERVREKTRGRKCNEGEDR